jgi:hypothetical protein
MRRNYIGRRHPSLPCSCHCHLWLRSRRGFRYFKCSHHTEMTSDQSLIYFDLPVCPVTQVPESPLPSEGMQFKNNSIKVTKRACMARGRNPAEVWIETPGEVDFCPSICCVRHICFSWKERVFEGFFWGKGPKRRRPWGLWLLTAFFFSFPWGKAMETVLPV